MSIAKGTFTLKCSGCGKLHNFTEEKADFDNTGGSERQMGTENQYTWETSFKCDNCGNEIEVEYDVWEYPVGAFNMDEVKIIGGTEINRFSYEFIDEPADEDFE